MMMDVQVACGLCGGQVTMHTCYVHSPADPWVTHSRCEGCGHVRYVGCEACFPDRKD